MINLKRGCGRPRKYPPGSESSAKHDKLGTTGNGQLKRGPGRPHKNEVTIKSPSSVQDNSIKRGPGRPCKYGMTIKSSSPVQDHSEEMDVCTKNELSDLSATEIITIKHETEDNYDAMVIIGEGNEKDNITEDFKISEEECVKIEHDPLSTNSAYSNNEDDMEQSDICIENDWNLNLNESYDGSEEKHKNSLRNIRITKSPILSNCVEENVVEESLVKYESEDDDALVKYESVEEFNQNSESSESDSNEDKDNDHPLPDNANIDKYLKMWKVLYPEVDGQEQRNIHQENKGSVRQTMDKMRLLNEERKQKKFPVIHAKMKRKIRHANLNYPLVDNQEQMSINTENNSNVEQTILKLQHINDEDKRRISPEPEKQNNSLKDGQRNVGIENSRNVKLSVSYNEHKQSISVERIALEPVCLRGIRIKKSHIGHNTVEANSDEEVSVKSEPVEENQSSEINDSSDDNPLQEVDTQMVELEEDNLTSEKSGSDNNEDKDDGSPLQDDAKIDKYLKMWKVLYPEVNVKEQRNIYQEKKGSVRQSMDKMRLLNDERKSKHSRVCKMCQKDTDTDDDDDDDDDEVVNHRNRRRKRSKIKRKKIIKYDCEECCTWLVSGDKPCRVIKPKRNTIDQFIEEWKLHYPLVNVEEQVHIYVENNSNIEQTVSILKHLNDVRKKRISVELDCKIKDLKDTRKEDCSTEPKVS